MLASPGQRSSDAFVGASSKAPEHAAAFTVRVVEIVVDCLAWNCADLIEERSQLHE